MINRFLFIFGTFFVLLPYYCLSQHLIQRGDTLTITFEKGDTENIQWQFSDDLLFWKPLKQDNQQLIINTDETGFYRVKVKTENRTSFSDTVFIYVPMVNYHGPQISDNPSQLKLSWDYAIPNHLINEYLISIEGCDSVITLPNWRNSLLIDRKMAYYSKLFTIQAIPNGNFALPLQTIRYENNFSRFFNHKPLYVAHRGLSSIYPENTKVAFEKAVEAGFTYVECDVRLTKDDVWVLNHDNTIDRTSDGKGEIADFYYDDLKKFDFAARKNYEGRTFQKILTLTDFCYFCKEHHLKPIIEIKEEEFRHLNLVNLLTIINSYLPYDSYSIHCFDVKTLRKIRRIDEEVIVGMLTKKYKSSQKLTIRTLYPCFYNLSFSRSLISKPLTEKSSGILNQLYQSGCFMGTWTVDNPKYFENMLSNQWFILIDTVPPLN